MSIMPADGWGDLNARQNPPVQPVEISCPSCGSPDWKSAALVHREGLALGAFASSGSVVGVARTGLRHGQYSIGAASYKGRTVGTSQTVLSKMAAPPARRFGFSGCLIVLAVFCGFGCLINLANSQMGLGTVIFGAIAVVLLLIFINTREKQKEEYSEAAEVYDRMRMCTRCGTFYTA